jgi:hypothetical protein
MKALNIESRGDLAKFGLAGGVAVLMLAAVIWASGAAFAASYSKASIKGSYAFHGSGLGLFAAPGQPSAGPRWSALVGTVSFDGDGHFNGESTITSTPMQGVPTPGEHRATGEKANTVQQTCKYKFTGTYEVGADGMGTASFTNTSEDTGCATSKQENAFVVSSGGRMIHVVSTGINVPDTSAGVFASDVNGVELVKQ